MRSYSSLLVFEDIFDYVPTTDPDVSSLANMLFTPNVPVVSADCQTTLGLFQTVNYELEGAIELATGQIISKTRIDQLLYTGTYEVATRSTSTCIAPNGVCQACYHASYQSLPVPAIGSRVTLQPEYIITTQVISAMIGDVTWNLTQADNTYQLTHIYIQGVLQNPSTYSILNQVLTWNAPLTTDNNIVVHYTSYNRAPYLVYLAKTYSGSMLGMKPLPAQMLPIRSLLLESIVPSDKLQSVVQYTQEVPTISQDYKTYLETIADPLEQALFAIAINCIYANAT